MYTTDLLTLKAVLLYILKNSSKRDMYSVVKTAYFAQQKHLAKYALPIFNDNIVALQFGPVPSTIYDILKNAQGKLNTFSSRQEITKIASAISFKGKSFSANENPDMDYLSTSNVECLNDAIKFIAGLSFGKIVNESHGEEWNRAFNSSNNTMDNLSIAREGGASEANISYLEGYFNTLSVLN